jgi:hypothetical protein
MSILVSLPTPHSTVHNSTPWHANSQPSPSPRRFETSRSNCMMLCETCYAWTYLAVCQHSSPHWEHRHTYMMIDWSLVCGLLLDRVRLIEVQECSKGHVKWRVVYAAAETCWIVPNWAAIMLYLHPTFPATWSLPNAHIWLSWRRLCWSQGRSVNFWMIAYLAFDSSDTGALPGRSTTTVYTFAWVAASASVQVQSQ